MKKIIFLILLSISFFTGFSQNIPVSGFDTTSGRPGYIYTLKPTNYVYPFRVLNDTTISFWRYVSQTKIIWPSLLYSGITTSTFADTTLSLTPSLANQTAWYVLNNPTSGSTTPVFSLLNIHSINATGTPSSTTFLRGDGSWSAAGGGGSGWLLTGNSGLNAVTNFLGTTDNTNLVFRRNNLVAGIIDSTTGLLLTSFGANAGNVNVTGANNSIYGNGAAHNLTSGGNNTANGTQAGYNFTTAGNSTAIGYNALYTNSTGGNNTAIGYSSQKFTVTASGYGSNTSVGSYSMQGNTTGANNTAIGSQVMISANTSSNNTAIGQAALYNQASGTGNNTALGFNSLVSNTSGAYNLGLGASAGLYNTTVSNQIFINTVARTNYSGDQTASPIYVQQNAVVKNQIVTLNGVVGINDIAVPNYAALSISDTAKGVFLPRLTNAQKTGIATGVGNGVKVSGSGYTSAFYGNVILLGGSGTGATAAINIVGGLVSSVTINNQGINYQIGDILTASTAIIGAGAGFTYTVNALTPVSKGLIVYDSTKEQLSISKASTKSNVDSSWDVIPITKSFYDLTAQSSTGNILTLTSNVNNSTYQVGGYLNVTAISTDVIQLQCTYTDENSTSQTVSFANISTATNAVYNPVIVRVKANTLITLKTNNSTGGGTETFDAGGFIQKMY